MKRTELPKCENIYAPSFIKPELIFNNPKDGKKVLTEIENELSKCNEFAISVAFITRGGITPLLQILKELEENNIPGKILTTDYLTFSDPVALRKLSELKNIELKMFITNGAKEGFHTKGYIFKHEELYKIIVGSSNMTMNALTVNKEWNTKVVLSEQEEYTQEVLNEFNNMWNSESALGFDEFIDEYEIKYKELESQKRLNEDTVVSSTFTLLKPNSMQIGFIDNLKDIYGSGNDKALLVSSTGTGKTLASAFAIKDLGFERVLFLVHRNQIAIQAMNSYQRVFGAKHSMGLLCGSFKQTDKDYIFATVQTLSKDYILDSFEPDTFDAIVVDEAHHGVADSYKKIMDYFKPKLWLGMTATPDRRDADVEGRNVYEIFDHNIALEIRLQDAMEEDLLCPFHYFGITDLEIVDDQARKKREEVEYFKILTSEERVDNIIKYSKYYGYSGKRVKGLIFCSRIGETEELSKALNDRGYRTIALNGSASEEERTKAIERLAGEDCEDALDYILSVDIFSEGVDVPEINQIIMLRPTQSPIVFIQQLGRGLRKAKDKEYVVVLDFIGNYDNNFMIPIALSGDRSYNKDNVRKYIAEGTKVIPGSSTIHFDEISRKKIFKAIDSANFSNHDLIFRNYMSLKDKLGRIPSLKDFDEFGEMDVLRIFESDYGSYHKFLKLKDKKDYHITLSEDEEKMIEFISVKLASGKRIYELALLNCLLSKERLSINDYKKQLMDDYGKTINNFNLQNTLNILINDFLTGTGRNTYKQCVFIENDIEDGYFKISNIYQNMLKNITFYNMVKELVEFGISRYIRDYSDSYKDTDFVLNKKYTYEDVCRLLGWEKNIVPLNIGGYKFDEKTNSFPVFINYDKDETVGATINYKDHFVDNTHLIAISKGKRNLESDDVQNFIHSDERKIDVELFVKKNNKDNGSKEFYYLGKMHYNNYAKEFIMENTENKAVELEWKLETPVREDLYDYIVNE